MDQQTPEPPDTPEQGKIDSRMRSFLRRAGPVIASERGLTEGARVKLRSIASDMDLPDEMFDQAIASLQNEPPVIKRELTRYEQAFEDSMRSKLQKIPRGILTTKIENRAVSIGSEKYQLTELQSREILRTLVGELKLQRISVTQTERHMEATIEDLIGEKTYASEETRQRLIEFGENMGLPNDHVDAMIRHYVDLNLLNKKNEGTLIKVLAGFLGVTVVVITCLVVWMMMSPAKSDPKEIVKKDTGKDDEPVLIKADFWDDDLMLAAMNCGLRNPKFVDVQAELSSSDPTKRQAGIDQLVETIPSMLADKQSHSHLATLIEKLIQLEPDDGVAMMLLDRLSKSVSVDRENLPLKREFAERALFIVDTITKTKLAESSPVQRKQMAGDELFNLTGVNSNTKSLASARTEYQSGLFESHLQRLTGMISDLPDDAINSHSTLFAAAPRALTDSKRLDLRLAFVMQGLEPAGGKWQLMKPALEWTVERARPEQLVQLVSLYESLDNPAAQRELGTMLVDAIGIPNATSSPADIAKSFRRKLGVSEPLKIGLERKREEFDAGARKLRVSVNPSATDTNEIATSIAIAAYWTTFASYLRRGDIESDDFKKLEELGPPDGTLNDEYVAAIVGDTDEGSADTGPGEDDKRVDPAKLVKILRPVSGNFASQTRQRRIGALQDADLAFIASKIDDAPPATAIGLARYVVASKHEGEHREVMVALRHVAHWPTFLVGVADFLEASDAADAPLIQIAGVLLDEPGKAEDRKAWVQLTRLKLLEKARIGYLKLKKQPTEKDSNVILNRLQTIEGSFTRQRALNFGVSPTTLRADTSTDAILRNWYRHVAMSSPGSGLGSGPGVMPVDSQRELAAADFLAENSLQSVVFKQRLLMDSLASGTYARKVSSRPDVQKRLTELRQAGTIASNVFQQMLVNELMLVELMLLEN